MGHSKIIWQNIKKEYLTLIRKPASLILCLFFPLIALIVFGVSFPGEFLGIKVAPVILIEDSSNKILVSSLKEKIASEDFDLTVKKGDESFLKEAVKSKDYLLGIYPKILDHQTKILIFIDNSNPLAGQIALAKLKPKLEEDKNLFLELKNIYEEKLRFVDYLFPGIIALSIMFISLDLASIGVVKERLIGSLERILSSPFPLWLFLAGKYIAYIILAFLSGVIVLIGGKFLFNIPIAGSIWLVILLEISTALPFIGLALVTSTISKSEFEAHVIADFIALPLMLISGVFFPIQCMPNYIQRVAEVLPLTYSVEALRDVIIRGLGFSDIAPAFGALIIYTLIFFILAIFVFKKRK
jgi:ABC-2 type transport system permease protein